MPLKSKAQADKLKKEKPEIYAKLLAETPQGIKLPHRIKPKKK